MGALAEVSTSSARRDSVSFPRVCWANETPHSLQSSSLICSEVASAWAGWPLRSRISLGSARPEARPRGEHWRPGHRLPAPWGKSVRVNGGSTRWWGWPAPSWTRRWRHCSGRPDRHRARPGAWPARIHIPRIRWQAPWMIVTLRVPRDPGWLLRPCVRRRGNRTPSSRCIRCVAGPHRPARCPGAAKVALRVARPRPAICGSRSGH